MGSFRARRLKRQLRELPHAASAAAEATRQHWISTTVTVDTAEALKVLDTVADKCTLLGKLLRESQAPEEPEA